jgi:hypothetical protein
VLLLKLAFGVHSEFWEYRFVVSFRDNRFDPIVALTTFFASAKQLD